MHLRRFSLDATYGLQLNNLPPNPERPVGVLDGVVLEGTVGVAVRPPGRVGTPVAKVVGPTNVADCDWLGNGDSGEVEPDPPPLPPPPPPPPVPPPEPVPEQVLLPVMQVVPVGQPTLPVSLHILERDEILRTSTKRVVTANVARVATVLVTFAAARAGVATG